MDNCDGIERIPIMKLALEEINERCDLLPGYRLIVDYANSAVSLLDDGSYIAIYMYSSIIIIPNVVDLTAKAILLQL